MTDYADRATVRQLVKEMKPEYIVCRGKRQHDLQPENLVWNDVYKFRTATEVCSRCGLRMITEMTEDWTVLARWPEKYPEGYLLTGVGRIAGDAFNEIRGAYYQQVWKQKRMAKSEATASPPRRAATREALGINAEPEPAPSERPLRLVRSAAPRRARKAG